MRIELLLPPGRPARFNGHVATVRRFVIAIGAICVVTVIGVTGYMLLGFTFLEALYQTCLLYTSRCV